MSESFTASWLALREPADAAARDPGLLRDLAAWCRSRRQCTARRGGEPGEDPVALRVVDLGSGSGANLRALSSHLGPCQRWRLLDRDAELLRIAVWEAARCKAGAAVCAEVVDLTDTGAAFAAPVDVVTASALLDLASERWLMQLCARIRAASAAAYFALSYDGSAAWDPQHPLDSAVLASLNRHQRRNKGLDGTALGPSAAAFARDRLGQLGMRVASARSDWVLAAAELRLQHALLAHWENAAAEEGSLSELQLKTWTRARQEWIDGGSSRLRLGHLDLLALPR